MPSSVPRKIIMKVPANADAKRLAQALSHVIYDNQEPVLQCVGASAVNQAVKAVTIAGGLVSNRGISLNMKSGFVKIQGEDGQGEINAVTLRVRPE